MSEGSHDDPLGKGEAAILALGEEMRSMRNDLRETQRGMNDAYKEVLSQRKEASGEIHAMTVELRALSHKMVASDVLAGERLRSFELHDKDAKETRRAIRGYAVTVIVAFLLVLIGQTGWIYAVTDGIKADVANIDARDRASAQKGWTWGDAIDSRLNGHDEDWRAHRQRHGDKLGPRVKHKQYDMDTRPDALTPEYE